MLVFNGFLIQYLHGNERIDSQYKDNNMLDDTLNIEITSDFECGSGTNIHRTGKNTFFVQIQSDPPTILGSGYDWYFCVKVTNKENIKATISIVFSKKPLDTRSNSWLDTEVPVFQSDDGLIWKRFSKVQENSEKALLIEITLGPCSEVYISNSIPHKYSTMSSWLKEISNLHSSFCYLSCIGRSVEDREIFVLTITEPVDKSLILLSEGRHMKGILTNLSTTLASQITRELSTITYTKYHLHLKHGEKACKELSVLVLKTILETVEKHRPLKRFLRKPYGETPYNLFLDLIRKLYQSPSTKLQLLRKVLTPIYKFGRKFRAIY